jgi:prepilin-type N-terminal cleavage/methylation domain-containing protein
MKNKGFTLAEIVVVLAMAGVLGAIALVSMASSKDKVRDTQRISDISTLGRLFALKCFVPHKGAGTYDLSEIINEIKQKNPSYVKILPERMEDPMAMSGESLYKYTVTNDGEHCVLYANLENKNSQVTLPEINTATMGGRMGIFEAVADGWNGTKKYYQVSK